MLDLRPATRVLADLVVGVRDAQLDAPTPCPDAGLGALLDHVDMLSTAFTAAAAKTEPAGGIDLPAEVAGVVALDEVVVHGWDIAVASGQPFSCDPELLAAVYEFVQAAAQQNPGGTPGLFGPPVPVADDAPALDRLIGLTGRDPRWTAPS